jgi:hypothetical protein
MARVVNSHSGKDAVLAAEVRPWLSHFKVTELGPAELGEAYT